MIIDKEKSDVEICFENICKNYGVVAGLRTIGPVYNCSWHDISTVFIDINVSSCFDVHNKELLIQIAQKGIKSKKAYRKLRNLVRIRMINAICDIRDLAEDSLRNLGAKI